MEAGPGRSGGWRPKQNRCVLDGDRFGSGRLPYKCGQIGLIQAPVPRGSIESSRPERSNSNICAEISRSRGRMTRDIRPFGGLRPRYPVPGNAETRANGHWRLQELEACNLLFPVSGQQRKLATSLSHLSIGPDEDVFGGTRRKTTSYWAAVVSTRPLSNSCLGVPGLATFRQPSAQVRSGMK